jgi:group I intron endonuclease
MSQIFFQCNKNFAEFKYNYNMRYFIYQITNLKNNRFYIGQHRCDGEFLDSNYYGSGTAIVRAVKKHGIQNFKREVLVECTSEAALNFMESVYVGPELINDKKCYNLKTGGMGGNHSEETKAKMSAAQKNRIFSEEHKAKLSAAAKNRTHSEEAKAKLSASGKGKTLSEETKAKISATQKGRTLSEEHKAKLAVNKKAYYAKKRGE